MKMSTINWVLHRTTLWLNCYWPRNCLFYVRSHHASVLTKIWFFCCKDFSSRSDNILTILRPFCCRQEVGCYPSVLHCHLEPCSAKRGESTPSSQILNLTKRSVPDFTFKLNFPVVMALQGHLLGTQIEASC